MKLLFLIKTLVLHGGGAERVFVDLTASLAGRGHDVIVASFDAVGEEPFYPIAPAVKRVALGIGDVRANTKWTEGPRRIRALRRLARRERPNVAVGFMHSAYLPLGAALLGTGIPLVASEHISWDHYRSRPFQGLLLRLASVLAREITILSEPVRAGFPASLRRRMTVVPNPVDIEGHRPANVDGAEGAHRTLLAVGRLEPQKDHRVLIAAFARIAADFPDWRLRIVGEGILRKELEAQIAGLGLQDRVELPGATAQVDAEYAAAQLFVMPSAFESFGLATAEALGHSLPVVGFADCPGTNELVRDGVNGRLVAGLDREVALAEGLADLMASADLRRRLGQAGPGSVGSFAPDRVVDIWESLLRRAAGE